MSDRFLFWMPTLIWATTWHVILYEIGEVPALYSVAMRFALAAVMLFAIAGWRGESLQVSKNVHPWLALTGALQYGLNYVGTYESERYLPSGLVAVLFSLMIFTNAIGGALFLAQPIARRIAIGGCMGVTGVALIFWPDITAAGANPNAWLGIGLGLMAVTFASLGNILTLRISREGMALVPLLAYSAGLRRAGGFVDCLGQRRALCSRPTPQLLDSDDLPERLRFSCCLPAVFQTRPTARPSRAGLMGMVIPVIALGVSAVLEDWRPTPIAGLGIALCLGGLWSATRRAAAN
ncbi:MAG: DMT family transporter [Rhodocyclaceae bacterium]|nr:DMT family transporter [Rhodocyclaceae bacterium]